MKSIHECVENFTTFPQSYQQLYIIVPFLLCEYYLFTKSGTFSGQDKINTHTVWHSIPVCNRLTLNRNSLILQIKTANSFSFSLFRHIKTPGSFYTHQWKALTIWLNQFPKTFSKCSHKLCTLKLINLCHNLSYIPCTQLKCPKKK